MTPHDLVLTPLGLRFLNRRYPCTVGAGGLTASKREGDMATPIGTHHIVAIHYRPDRMPPPAPWATPIGLRDIWSDDSDDPGYNHLGRAPHPYSHEAMRRADPLYDLVMVTDWNWPDAVPAGGSCIFIHQWRRPGYPTAGCVALRPDHLRDIAARVAPGTRLVVRS